MAGISQRPHTIYATPLFQFLHSVLLMSGNGCRKGQCSRDMNLRQRDNECASTVLGVEQMIRARCALCSGAPHSTRFSASPLFAASVFGKCNTNSFGHAGDLVDVDDDDIPPPATGRAASIPDGTDYA
jgi:hypothetical protein